MDISKLSRDERAELLRTLKEEERTEQQNRKDAYEALRAQFLSDVESKLMPAVNNMQAFHDWLVPECDAWRNVMLEYGKLRKGEFQDSFTSNDDRFKVVVKNDKVKSFDERADLAAARLVEYLKEYVKRSEKGIDDNMYQLAMVLLERNKQGDLEYKSISKLYALKSRFDDEYTEIMQLFEESNVVYKTAINYYFYKRDADGVWRKIEPSFNRM